MASAHLRTLYRAARKHNVGGFVGESALSAWRAARILRRWEALEDRGAVRLIAIPDGACDPSEYSDDPDDEAFGVIGEHRTDFDNVDSDGCWEWYPGDVDDESIPWHHADSVWGNVGYDDVTDWRDNAYVLDIMDATIDSFRDAWKAFLKARRDRQAGLCPTCHGTGQLSA